MSLVNKFFGFDESKKPPQEEAPAPVSEQTSKEIIKDSIQEPETQSDKLKTMSQEEMFRKGRKISNKLFRRNKKLYEALANK